MQYTVTPSHESAPPRRAAVNALAIVGFIALVFLGIWLAIYAASFIPGVVSRIGQGLGLAGSGNSDGNGIVVVPPSDEPDDYEWEPAPAAPVAPTTPVTPAKPSTPAPTAPANPVIGYRTVVTDYPTPGSIKVPANGQTNLHGEPNLEARITAVGYVDSRGNNFKEDDTIDEDDRLAVKFTVTNTGTNKADSGWKVEVTLPTKEDRSFEFTSRSQPALNPGDRVDFIAYVDRGDAREGNDQEIRIEADVKDDIDESNERDNTDTEEITVRD